MKKTLLAFTGLAILIACNQGPAKKLLIIGRGDIKAAGEKITMTDGSGYTEKTIDVAGSEPKNFQVKAPSLNATITVPASQGLYILNLKTDTLVGSRQEIGKDLSNRTISQEELRIKIDSLKNLVAGKIPPAGKSFIILPGKIQQVSASENAKVFGPFTKIPASLDADKDGNLPEIFKFYTNTEMRELIANLQKMTY